ncbi:hypothetical protein BD626DRAFT_83663 [Schizophyllum amplum]|uniref:Fungal-specific transcription factor domain-containing protein n=1 Tax=Schizophyllum amplum TaxID=97359 RepID=A0A550BS26_9AGAR|nr:hypothetical protein BD626DRAFT_83663 [Auriculariopsis ampla]
MPSPTPLVPLLSYKDQMTSCGWDFRSHAPQKRILTLCILAAASLVSVEPSYVGYDPSGDRFSAAHLKWDAVSSACVGAPQMGELGARRKLLSARLHGEAVRQAHQDGITSFASIENATSCFLLNVLDVTYTPNSTHPWAAAAVWQLRTVSELGVIEAVCQLPDVSSRDTSCLQWRGFLSLLAVYAMNAGKSLPFSTYDELLICGPSPASLDQMFSQAEHIPPHVAVVQLVRSFTAHGIRLMRDVCETLLAVPVRDGPLDDLHVLRLVTAAEHFHADLARYRRFTRRFGDGPGLRLCLHSISLPCCAVAVALYNTLSSRAAGAGGLIGQLRVRARALAVRAVVDTTTDVRDVVVTHWLGLNQAGGFEAWARVLVEDVGQTDFECQAAAIDDGSSSGYQVSAEERTEALVRLRDLIQFSAFFAAMMLSSTPTSLSGSHVML